ncbi:MAG: dienelactone hydrolase family protein [Clostridia bacterium]|nr:dienelactone hydrolase family protein [Clostridia bacterium]
MPNYREDVEKSKEFKQNYVDGFERVISARQQELAQKRAEYTKNIFKDGERFRADFKKMLGWPLVDCKNENLPSVKTTKLATEDGYTIYRMQFEILDGIEMTGLYFEQNTNEKKPLVLVQHGGLGTPEFVSGVYGSTDNYNDMLERVIKQGVHAFTPQLLLWDDGYNVPFNRVNIDARLKRVGGSVTSVELYGLTRILDYFESKENVKNFGMVGMSYGGFYTLFMSAIDTRIKSAVSCSFFNTRDSYPWCDWTWFNAAEKFDDAEVACLVYPRKLCIEIGENDEVFDAVSGKKSYEKLLNLCKEVGTDWLEFITFEGTHEFCKFDEPIEKLAKDLL